jgi:hypothetical protein
MLAKRRPQSEIRERQSSISVPSIGGIWIGEPSNDVREAAFQLSFPADGEPTPHIGAVDVTFVI